MSTSQIMDIYLLNFSKKNCEKIGFQRLIVAWNAAKAGTFFLFYFFLPYAIPDFGSEIWHRLLAIFFSIDMINLKFCFWLVSKIIIRSPFFSLNISMANFWRFLSWIVKELYFSWSSSKVHWWLLYTILRAYLCILFILWLSFLLWNINTNGQYEHCESLTIVCIVNFTIQELWKLIMLSFLYTSM